MVCDACGNKEATRISFRKDSCACDKCGDNPSFHFSDVYFDAKQGAYFDPHIANDRFSPKGTWIKSREHKAFLMKELGIVEKGDKRHGAR